MSNRDSFFREVESDLVNRPKISQMVIDKFSDIVDQQDNKGWKKYGTTIDDADDVNYDWKLMALEESADLVKYLIKENNRLQKNLNVCANDKQVETTQTKIFNDIQAERTRQDRLHPHELNLSMRFITIMEEAGEVAEAMQENDMQAVYRELIDTAACCVRMAEDVINKSKPYTDVDCENAREQGLDLDDWDD